MPKSAREPLLKSQMESPPQQERSRETLRKLLEGAEQLFAEVPINEATVPQICARAGCTTGAFYRRFRDKDELLDTLFADLIDDVAAVSAAALSPVVTADLDLRESVRRFVEALVDVYMRRAGLCRAIMLCADADDRYRERVTKQARHVSRQLAAMLAGKRAEFDHPDNRLAADFAFRQVFATLDQTVRFPGFAPTIVKLNDAALAMELTRGFLGYIGYRGQSKGS
jgi:AcrR family transcriptional regulator